MRTAVTEMFGIEVPLFAFSHCRDVVLEVSKAGGMGVLGAAWMTPEELEVSLNWIDARIEGKPYAVDIVFPGTYAPLDDARDPETILPQRHRQFVDKLLQDADIPDMPEADARRFAFVSGFAPPWRACPAFAVPVQTDAKEVPASPEPAPRGWRRWFRRRPPVER